MKDNRKHTTFKDKFKLEKRIGSGSFGDVYKGKDIKRKISIALKVEELNKKRKTSKLQIEHKIYKILHKNEVQNIPKIYEFIKTKKFHIMNMKLLGESLDVLFERYDRRFDLPTTLKLGINMIDIMKDLHKSGIIHRDIKPNNFMMGRKDPGKLYVMDFGLSKQFMKGNKHIKPTTGRNLVGTARYAGLNVHYGIEPARRDDMESIGYMLVYFMKGRLPWQGLKKDEKTKQLDKIKEVKMSTKVDKLCLGLPQCFSMFLKYIKSCGFYDEPDYDYMKELFISTAREKNIELEYMWSNSN
jgi:serine/threonine protein kinase